VRWGRGGGRMQNNFGGCAPPCTPRKSVYDLRIPSSYVKCYAFSRLFLYISRAATGENWHYIMLACTSDALCTDDAVPDKTGETCGSDIAYLYFISFVFLCSFLVS
jgi:hypothetical protein